jgi:cyclophilin family peptidyl-prolyl cis-trans isomerase
MCHRSFLVGIFSLCLVSALRADLTSPVVVQTLPATSLGRAGATAQLNLNTYIKNPNVNGTAVRITVRRGTLGSGNIDIALTDAQTPLTVANFLAYINAGRYAQNIVHRSIAGFVVQGGGYLYTIANGNATVGAVTTFSAVQNEPGISNVRGTIAMAKQSGNINSATSQWFINMADNSANLDNQNGGFTVFGRVLGNGMTVADAVNSMSTFNASGFIADWTDIPLSAASLDIGNIVETNMAVVPGITYAASSANTSLVTTSLSGNTLTLTPSSSNIGTTNITITATDIEGSQLSSNFTVSVLDTYANWQAGFSFGNATLAGETANPDGDNLPNLAEYAFGGDPLHPTTVVGAPKMESGGGVTFYIKQQAALAYEVDRSVDLVNWTKVWQTSDGFSAAAVFSRTVLSGFDQLVIRDPSPPGGNLHFWRVQVTRSL